MGFEPMIRVLQTLALPLGHVAISMKIIKSGRTLVNQNKSDYFYILVLKVIFQTLIKKTDLYSGFF
jgi:hypothetical protein